MASATSDDEALSLHGVIRRVLRESQAVEPSALAQEVFDRVPAAARDDALMQALRSLVRETRPPAFIPRECAGPADEGLIPAQQHRRPSVRVAAIRGAWQATLAQRIAVADGHKFLRDCTVLDLEYAATQREQHAKRVAARARDLRKLAAVMRNHGASVLSDVPAEVLAGMHDALAEAAA